MRDFAFKKIFITGGSSGIGLETARLLAAKGAHVWLAARRMNPIGDACRQIRTFCRYSTQIISGMSMDVSNYQQVEKVLSAFIKQNGVPDIVINSAGITYPGNFSELDIDIFRNMMEVNYLGTVNVLKVFIPGMIARRSGYIANISSMAGLLGIYGYSAYGASKYAIRGLSDVLRAELKPYKIRVSVLYPSDTDTPQLAFEESLKSPITREIGGGKVVSAASVAACLVSGIARNQYFIIPGLDNKILYRLSELFGSTTCYFMDKIIAQAMRKHKIKP
jgi:3-dehydrosphinganine reductase